LGSGWSDAGKALAANVGLVTIRNFDTGKLDAGGHNLFRSRIGVITSGRNPPTATPASIRNVPFTSIRDVAQTSQMRKYRPFVEACRTGQFDPLLT
jgi:hypothetical protein